MTEEELVKEGKRLLSNGTPRMDLYKYMQEQVPFNNQKRIRILQQIMPDANQNSFQQKAKTQDNPKTPEELKLNREVIKAKYQIKDFEEAINKTVVSGLLLILIGLVYLVSTFIFGAFNLPTALICIVGGGILIVARKLVNWDEIEQIYAIITVAAFMILLEFIAFGLPDLLIPPRGSTTFVINAISPLIYLIAKPVILFFPIILTLIHKLKKDKIPNQIKEKLSA